MIDNFAFVNNTYPKWSTCNVDKEMINGNNNFKTYHNVFAF